MNSLPYIFFTIIIIILVLVTYYYLKKLSLVIRPYFVLNMFKHTTIYVTTSLVRDTKSFKIVSRYLKLLIECFAIIIILSQRVMYKQKIQKINNLSHIVFKLVLMSVPKIPGLLISKSTILIKNLWKRELKLRNQFFFMFIFYWDNFGLDVITAKIRFFIYNSDILQSDTVQWIFNKFCVLFNWILNNVFVETVFYYIGVTKVINKWKSYNTNENEYYWCNFQLFCERFSNVAKYTKSEFKEYWSDWQTSIEQTLKYFKENPHEYVFKFLVQSSKLGLKFIEWLISILF